MEVLRRGEASRSYASTNMNAESSRSHTIYRVTIDVTDNDEIDSGAAAAVVARVSYLNLVDLAGKYDRIDSTPISMNLDTI